MQAALNEANRGDTIKLQAGRIFPSNKELIITARPGVSGYLRITTTTPESRLPEPNTRITPAYAELLPTIQARGQYALGIAGNDTPAAYIELVGLRFSTGVNIDGQGPLLIGNNANEFGISVTSASQQPDNVIVDRCIFDQDNDFAVRRMIWVNSRTATIKNSYIDGVRLAGVDTQAILATQAVGPITIENNYIGGASENVLFGGVGNRITGAPEGTVRFNYFDRREERMRFRPWRPGMVAFKGLVIRPSAATGRSYVARNSGVTGNAEPAWPIDANGTVTDNGITWRLFSSSGSAHLVAKNHFEIKNARNMKIQHNVFAKHWIDGQDASVVFKLANCTAEESDCVCVPEFAGAVNTNGTLVTSADGNPLPNIHAPQPMHNYRAGSIQIGGVSYDIASMQPEFRLMTDAGIQNGVPYTYGQPGCRASWDKDITFSNNVIRGSAVGLVIAQWANGVRSQIGNITVKDNLFEDIDCRKWGDAAGNCGTSQYYIYLAALPSGIELSNNTLFGRNAALSGIHLEGRENLYAGDTKILNNIMPRGNTFGIKGGPYQEGSLSLDRMVLWKPTVPHHSIR